MMHDLKSIFLQNERFESGNAFEQLNTRFTWREFRFYFEPA